MVKEKIPKRKERAKKQGKELRNGPVRHKMSGQPAYIGGTVKRKRREQPLFPAEGRDPVPEVFRNRIRKKRGPPPEAAGARHDVPPESGKTFKNKKGIAVMPEFENADIKHTDPEITDFINEHKATVYAACGACGLCEADWDGVLYAVGLKYARGKMEFDPSKKASMSTFVYKVSQNEAINAWKKNKYYHYAEPASEEKKPKEDGVSEHNMAEEDCWLRINEALNRLSARRRAPEQIVIFIRHAIFQEPRDVVAEKLDVTPGRVSMTKNRLLPKFKRLLDTIAEEEAKGLFSKQGDKVFIRKEDLL